MLEIEIKARLDAPLSETAIFGLGFARGDQLRETDVYFNGTDRDFFLTDEALRLRFEENLTLGTSSSWITYKGPKLDSRSQTRKEIQTEISNLEKMTELFLALGYRDVFTVKKTRRKYEKDDVSLCIDQVEGLGLYMELELVSRHEGREKKEAAVNLLLSLLDGLAVPREYLTAKSYLELLTSL